MIVVSLCWSGLDASPDMQVGLLRAPNDLDLRSKFDLDLSRSQSICFDAS